MNEDLINKGALGDGFENEEEALGAADSLNIGGVYFTPAEDITVQELTVIVVLLFNVREKSPLVFEAEVNALPANVGRHFTVK
ncbi:MAG: hypothetical protein ACJ8EB_10875 [Allosphingosinicella sp.]